jgi:seryl-tRNA synthetase
MLDINDFVADRGGDLNKIRESQRRRYAPESVVEEVLELFGAARRGTQDFLLYIDLALKLTDVVRL